MNNDLKEWAAIQDWQHAQAVVGIGFDGMDDFVAICRECKPGIKIFVYHPGVESRRGNNLFFSGNLVDLRADIIDNMSLRGRIIYACIPKMKGKIGDSAMAAVAEAESYYLSMQLTARTHAKEWADIGLEILPKLVGKAVFNFVPSLFVGKPAVVVGAGPSLDCALDTLKEIQNRCVIVATNSAVIPLWEAGIQPDIVAAIEAKELSISPLIGHPAMKEAYLVPGIHAVPKLYDIECRGIFPAIQMVGPVGQWLCPNFTVPPTQTGGSVSTVAFRIAEQLGCSPIILTGVDCAQGPDNKSVYAGNVAHKSDGYSGMQTVKVEAWGGVGHVLSPHVLNTYRLWFEARGVDSDAELINASVGGAHIQGWEDKKLEDVEMPESFEIKTLMDNAIAKGRKFKPEDLRSALNEQIKEAGKFAGWASKVVKSAREMDRWLSKINTEKHKFNIVISSSVFSIEEVRNLPDRSQIETVISSMRRMRDNYRTMKKTIEQTINRIEDE